MASSPPPNFQGVLLQAEVAPGTQSSFEKKYLAATGNVVSPGNPPDYQNQANKRFGEYRAYFNDPQLAALAANKGFKVDQGGYLANTYSYRVSKKDFWWDLVNNNGMRLGLN